MGGGNCGMEILLYICSVIIILCFFGTLCVVFYKNICLINRVNFISFLQLMTYY